METKNNPVATVQRMFEAFKVGNMNALKNNLITEMEEYNVQVSK
jgi:hypothetical protein